MCLKCHPFYTGRQKIVDAGGRVERFRKRFGNARRQLIVRASRDSSAEQLSIVERTLRGCNDTACAVS